MARLGRVPATLAGGVPVLLLLAAGPSYAGRGGIQQCMDKAIDHNGEPPICTKVNGTWVASWPDDSAGSGFGAFGALVAIGLVISIAVVIWKVTTAQKLARQSGMDPGLATQMTLLTDNGLDATYLAASLRPPSASGPSTPAATPGARPAAAARLEDLKHLLERGLVTQVEYDQRRTAIIDSV
jgi:hypothetical protein